MTKARRRARRSARGTALVLVAALIAIATACQIAPEQDAFYRPPVPLPAGQNGDVIRSRTSTFMTNPVLPESGISSWQVLYRTQNATGQAIAVTGTVLVPEAAWTGSGPRPIVSWGVGTRGLGDNCAPSASLAGGTDYEGGNIKAVLDAGYAVVVTDYEGLGTPGTHTYMVGRSMGPAMLDAVRAAQRLPAAGLSADAPVGLVGYSQGGAAAGWAAQLAPTYAPELHVEGAVLGGVPADLDAVARGLDGSAFVAFALMAALGLDAAYPDLQLDGYLNATGTQLKADSTSVCIASVDGISTFLDTAFHHLSDYTTTNPLDTPTWQARLSEQKLGAMPPPFPVYQYHGAIDEIIPYGQAQQLRETWCAAGVDVTWHTELLSEHLTGMLTGFGAGLDWLGERFAGQSPSDNCSALG